MNKNLRTFALFEEERQTQKDYLRAYMQEHPASTKTRAPFWHFILKPTAALLTTLVVLVGLGSIGYAAETSLPGDVLYPVKVVVSEPLQGLLKIDPETKLVWEIELTNKRLEEARTLIYQERLEGQAEEALLASLDKRKKRLERAALNITTTEGQDLLDDLDIRLQGVIYAESSIVSSLRRQTSNSDDPQSYFVSISSLRLISMSSSNNTTSLQVKKLNNESIDRRKIKALQKISDVAAIQDALAATSSQDDPFYRQAAESLVQARNNIQRAEEAYQRGSLEESDSNYRQAQIETEKANYILIKLPDLQRERIKNEKSNITEKK